MTHRSLLAVLFAAATLPARAAVFCAGNAIELGSALHTAESNGENDIVYLEATTIHVDAIYHAVYSSAEDKNLFILGGYAPSCDTLAGPGAKTVIDGSGTEPLAYLSMYGGSTGLIWLQRIVWQNGAPNPSTAAEAFSVYTSGSLSIQQNAFLHLVGDASHASAISLNVAGAFDIANSVFASNISGTASNASTIFAISNGSGTAHITGNTVTANHGLNGMTNALRLSGTRTWSVANNIVHGNFAIYGLNIPGNTELRNSDIDYRSGTPAIDSGNLAVDPGFVDAAGDWHLRADSPLIDAGLTAAPGGIGSDDYDGRERVVYAAVDVGAYELQDAIFADGFDAR